MFSSTYCLTAAAARDAVEVPGRDRRVEVLAHVAAERVVPLTRHDRAVDRIVGLVPQADPERAGDQFRIRGDLREQLAEARRVVVGIGLTPDGDGLRRPVGVAQVLPEVGVGQRAVGDDDLAQPLPGRPVQVHRHYVGLDRTLDPLGPLGNAPIRHGSERTTNRPARAPVVQVWFGGPGVASRRKVLGCGGCTGVGANGHQNGRWCRTLGVASPTAASGP